MIASARPRNRRRRDEVRRRRADEEDERLRDRVRLERDDERIDGDARSELRHELAERHAEEDRDEREQEKRERESGRTDDARRRTGAGASHRSTITDVDFTIAAAPTPAFSPSSSTASRVMIATTRAGSRDVDLDAREEALDLDAPHDAAKAVARAQLVVGLAAQALDLGGGHEPPVRAVALRADATVAIPAAQGVEADPQRAGRLARGVDAHVRPSSPVGSCMVARTCISIA